MIHIYQVHCACEKEKRNVLKICFVRACSLIISIGELKIKLVFETSYVQISKKFFQHMCFLSIQTKSKIQMCKRRYFFMFQHG